MECGTAVEPYQILLLSCFPPSDPGFGQLGQIEGHGRSWQTGQDWQDGQEAQDGQGLHEGQGAAGGQGAGGGHEQLPKTSGVSFRVCAPDSSKFNSFLGSGTKLARHSTDMSSWRDLKMWVSTFQSFPAPLFAMVTMSKTTRYISSDHFKLYSKWKFLTPDLLLS